MSERPLKIFFSGIGGSGVSAIACFMSDKGHTVVGSDRAFDRARDHPVSRAFKSKGICLVPQDGNGIDRSFDFAVFSTAVEPDQPELVKAKTLGVPVKTRPEYLAEIVRGYKTIAVAGTSGKSTTSGMLAFLMQRLGLRPNFIGGGRVKQFRTETNPGNSITGDSQHLVIEACESDGTLVNYKPEHSIILNLDLDHHSIEKTAGMFETLLDNTSNLSILNADDDNLKKLRLDRGITFSIDSVSDYRAEDVVYKTLRTEFSLKGIKFSLSVPGKYNLYNAVSCITFLSQTGTALKDIACVLHEFKGIERRFDIHLNDCKRSVIDDYAHNPHKIAALMQTTKDLSGSICYIFQPHGFAPTRMMKNEYIRAFSENLRATDHLILLPIFYAGGSVSKDISSHDLEKGISAKGGSAQVVSKREAILEYADRWESFVVMGARDETLSDLARDIAQEIARKASNVSIQG